MSQKHDNKQLGDLFWSSILPLLQACTNTRKCPGLSDEQWIRIGIERSLGQVRSGREYIQTLLMRAVCGKLSVSHFFETLKSPRRLKLVQELNDLLADSMPTHPHSGIGTFEELQGIDCYAADGHYHRAATHDQRIGGKLRAVGHFFTLNMRTMGMKLLTSADLEGGRKKNEHDMHALKRIGTELRQGAPRGRQVLYVWDCAGIDIPQWSRWKQTQGVYFLSRLKENFKLTIYGENDYDKEDPVNRGVIADQLVTGASGGTTFRLVRYRCPRTGNTYAFITNHMKIRPGVIAWLYLRRWDIEKSFDTFKNKFEEQKAWATSATAKSMQAHFIAMAHNLCILLESTIQQEHGIDNEKETKRCQQRDHKALEQCRDNGCEPAPMLFATPWRRSQFCVKFIRWLRYHLSFDSFVTDAVASLRVIYRTL